MQIVKVFVFLFLLTNCCIGQRVWYVGTNGVDASTRGGFSNPFKTVTYASTKLSAGDTVKVFAGIYQNTNYYNGDVWKLEQTVRINNLNGTAAANITFKPYNKDKVVFRGDGDIVFQVRNSSYIRVEGFEIEGEVLNVPLDTAKKYQFAYKLIGDPKVYYRVPPGTPDSQIATMTFPILNNSFRPSLYSGMGMLVQGSHHVEILRNNIHHLCGTGLRVFQSDYYKLIENEVHNCSRRGAVGNHGLVVHSNTSIDRVDGVKCYISRNNVHHNYNEVYSWSEIKTFITPHIDEGKGISMQKNTRGNGWKHGIIQIDNNVTYFNGFSGVHVNEGVRMNIYNNTAYKNSFSGDGTNIGISVQDGDSIKVNNNISVAETSFGGYALSTNSPATLEFKNNFVSGLIDTDVNAIDQNTTFGNPLFRNPANFDFRLQSTSPCIGAASTSFSPTNDYFGFIRDANPDLGAIEYNSTEPALGLVVDIQPVDNKYLKWISTPDNNNCYFVVEKSADLISWNSINCINSTGAGQYSFLENTATGQNYYRVTQYNKQGLKTISNLVQFNINTPPTCNCMYLNVIRN
jgi:hypothetical protein